MLSPALKRSLVELYKLDSRERTAFENNLHSELLHLDKISETTRRFMTSAKRGKGAELPSRVASLKNVKNLSSLAILVTDLNKLPSTMSDV